MNRVWGNFNKFHLLVWSLALAYGAILSQIPSEQFKDFGNYLRYAEYSWSELNYWTDQGWLSALSNEPLWLLINSALATALSPEAVVRAIIFVSAALVASRVLLLNPPGHWWVFLILLLPVILDNHLVHIRQGAAIGLFLWGWCSGSLAIRWLLIGSTPFVHASFFFVLLVLWTAKGVTEMRLAADVRTIVFVAMGLVVGASLGWLAYLVGARQVAYYDFVMPEVSGLSFTLWLGVLALMIFEGRVFLREHAFEAGMLTFYLSTYWLLEIAMRIFTSALLLVLLAGFALSSWRRLAFLAAISAYGVITWVLRFNEPALGFGHG